MASVADLIARLYPSSGQELILGGLPVSQIVADYGTPLFVYDCSVLRRNWEALRAAYPARFQIYYSIKANPNQAIIRALLNYGCGGLEIASLGEYRQARASGCPPEDVLFAGPGKSEEELQVVLSDGIGEIHAESPTELDRISRISRRLGIRAPLALRINPSGDAEGGAMRMGGKPAQFGVDEETVPDLLPRILADEAVDFRGIHIFAGTQILDANILLAQYRKGLELARSICGAIGRPLRTIDFGGGLGIPYFSNEHELDLASLGAGLRELLAEYDCEPWLKQTRLLIEPGRFLAGEAGVYLARVNDVKISRGKRYVILDGGMNHHLAASGNLGQTIKRNYPVTVVNRLSESISSESADIVGPLCTPLDTLARSLAVPPVHIGDIVGVLQSGAYARAASPMQFLSHATPAEVMADEGHAWLVRRRGDVTDYLRDQVRAAPHAE